MSGQKFRIIAGLGNPGKDYNQTRHNIGFFVVDFLALKSNLAINQTRFDADYAKGRIKGQNLFIVKPLSYMNRSGIPIHKFASYYKVKMENIIIVHDDMDLEFGKIKIVKSRGHGGHNGLRSIFETFGKKDCIRVRVGVGRPGSGKNVVGHVLGGFTPDEIKDLDHIVDTASNACLHILEHGLASAMNLFNTKL